MSPTPPKNSPTEKALFKSEILFRKIVECSHDGILLMNAARKPFYVSPSYSKINGFTPEEWIDVHGPDFVHPDDREITASAWREVLESPDKVLTITYRLRHKLGHWFWVETTVSNLLDEPEVQGVMLNSCDISGRIEAEEKILEISERLQFAIKAAKAGVWDWNLHTNEMLWDDQMIKIYGLTRENFTAGVEAWQTGLHPDDSARALADCEAALRGEKDFDLEFRIKRPDGSVAHIKASGLVIRDARGAPVRMIGMNNDISERKVLEKARADAELQLLQSAKLASVGLLAAGVAHEINNPLTIIKGNIRILESLLSKTDESERAQKCLSNQNKAVDRVATIVNGLRTFARTDSEAVEPRDLHQTVQETLAFCEAVYAKQRLTIKTRFNAQDPFAKVNAGKFQQVILNLLENSKDACESVVGGGVIQFETSNEENAVVIKISDNGAGIAQAHLKKIFDPFFTTKGPGKGTGLGLSISHSIIQAFNGSLEVESEVGQGTTFTLKLPTCGEILAAGTTVSPMSQRGFSGSALIADDESEILEILSELVSSLGISVSTASDGDEALEALQNRNFDYVITDMRMPRMSGDLMIKEARKLPHLAKTRFIVVTGDIDIDNIKSDLDTKTAIADAVIQKPFDKKALANMFAQFQ